MKSNLKENPANIEKEISILRKIGLENYEIEFLVYQKYKNELRRKWEEKQEN